MERKQANDIRKALLNKRRVWLLGIGMNKKRSNEICRTSIRALLLSHNTICILDYFVCASLARETRQTGLLKLQCSKANLAMSIDAKDMKEWQPEGLDSAELGLRPASM
ncbi:hypothetical protein M5D96_000175 [Drosophila gunungcola]|uniref:Uncharacterized protein n=1 Tax=Drosophila gunungcola TaxID=103775 RepID=A0A9P9YVV4_9MUSC|nr:hypothetical protein M5D96_000175 [Drosophila gunungcola]